MYGRHAFDAVQAQIKMCKLLIATVQNTFWTVQILSISSKKALVLGCIDYSYCSLLYVCI